MNLIADRLFALLLGWTKSLFNSLWNLVTNDSGGAIGVLQRVWLPLILLMLVFGTAADYIIWLIRWRPYYVWSAWLRKRLEHRRLNRTRHYMEDLDHSPLDLPEYQYAQDDAQPLMDEPVYFDFREDWQLQSPLDAQPPQEQPDLAPRLMEEPPRFVPALPWENLRQVPVMSFDQPQQMAPLPLQPDAGVEQEPFQPQAWVEPAPFQPFMLDQEELLPPDLPDVPVEPQADDRPRRRRRVDSKRQRGASVLQSLRDTFFTGEEDGDALDELPPPITQEAAFHKPYYPQNYMYREQSAQQAPPRNPPQGGQAP